MNLYRIQQEFNVAKQQFANVQIYQTSDGNLYVKAALQTTYQVYIVKITFPGLYPNSMPTVFVVKPEFAINPPHFYNTGNICYLHPSMWNPGKHDLKFVIARTAKWLNKYTVWKKTGNWPGAAVAH